MGKKIKTKGYRWGIESIYSIYHTTVECPIPTNKEPNQFRFFMWFFPRDFWINARPLSQLRTGDSKIRKQIEQLLLFRSDFALSLYSLPAIYLTLSEIPDSGIDLWLKTKPWSRLHYPWVGPTKKDEGFFPHQKLISKMLKQQNREKDPMQLYVERPQVEWPSYLSLLGLRPVKETRRQTP